MITILDVHDDLEYIKMVYRFFGVVNDSCAYFAKIRFYNNLVETLDRKYRLFYKRYYIRRMNFYDISRAIGWDLTAVRNLYNDLQQKLLEEILKRGEEYEKVNRS